MNLIVNMEMPKDLAIIVTILPDGRIIKHLGYKDKKQIGKIVGVLPETHGDLIDRDVLYMAVKSHNTSDAAIARNHDRVTSLQNLSTIRKGYIAEKHICLDDIIRAEAVIKAERKDDEQADC